MALLAGFAFVAGFATCLSPCVLPVLPALLSGGATGGRRRPLGIVTGLVLSFTFATVALVYVIAALGLPNDIARTLAVLVLLGFGLSLIVPPLAARLQAKIARWARAPRARRGEGFLSGLPLGFGLGFLYAPCAGPILAGVITVSAAQTFTAARLGVALAYALGSALALYLIMLGGRRVARPLIQRSLRVQQALGALMVAVAVLVFYDFDVRFQTAVASRLPGFLTQPAQDLQQSEAIAGALAGTRGYYGTHEIGQAEAAAGRRLPVVGPAPEFTETQQWFNTSGGGPLSMAELRRRGSVVLVDFWTYTCINCIRTFPFLRSLDATYRDDGLVIVGVHTPEFPFEREADNVAEAIEQNELRYPVVQDNEYGTWDAYGNQFWPADYLVDARGRLRYVHFGEGDYETTERAVRSLLAEAGRPRLGAIAEVETERPSRGQTPEAYLGAKRAQGFVNGPIVPGARDFGDPPPRLPLHALAYGGRWTIGEDGAEAGPGASLRLRFRARRVFLVMGSPARSATVRVRLDGRPIPDRLAGEDVRDGGARIGFERLYRLVELVRVGRHYLELRFAAGVSGFAFTFG
ncbi:MAG: cytochrome c biogenesis protein DipZ [Solirubrobacterales bacterium]